MVFGSVGSTAMPVTRPLTSPPPDCSDAGPIGAQVVALRDGAANTAPGGASGAVPGGTGRLEGDVLGRGGGLSCCAFAKKPPKFKATAITSAPDVLQQKPWERGELIIASSFSDDR